MADFDALVRSHENVQGVVIDGLDIVVADFEAAGITAGLRASRVVIDVAHKIRDTQRELVPELHGDLKESIEATAPEGAPLGLGDLEAEIGPTDFKARWNEFGTVHMPPHPFVFPSAVAHADEFEQRMGHIVGDV